MLTDVMLTVAQVLRQCEQFCPQPEVIFLNASTSAPQQRRQLLSPAGGQHPSQAAPRWGWDDLEYSVGDTLNTGWSMWQCEVGIPSCASALEACTVCLGPQA